MNRLAPLGCFSCAATLLPSLLPPNPVAQPPLCCASLLRRTNLPSATATISGRSAAGGDADAYFDGHVVAARSIRRRHADRLPAICTQYGCLHRFTRAVCRGGYLAPVAAKLWLGARRPGLLIGASSQYRHFLKFFHPRRRLGHALSRCPSSAFRVSTRRGQSNRYQPLTKWRGGAYVGASSHVDVNLKTLDLVKVRATTHDPTLLVGNQVLLPLRRNGRFPVPLRLAQNR